MKEKYYINIIDKVCSFKSPVTFNLASKFLQSTTNPSNLLFLTFIIAGSGQLDLNVRVS